MTQEPASPSTSTPAATAAGDILQRLAEKIERHRSLRQIHGGQMGIEEKLLQDAHDEIRERRAYVDGEAVDLLRRIAKANVIFPSVCANNMEAWNLAQELKKYLPSSPDISK